MIEELEEYAIYNYLGHGEKEQIGSRPPSEREMMHKVNELVRRVNLLSKALVVLLEDFGNGLSPKDRTQIVSMLLEAGLIISDGDIKEQLEDL